MGYARVKCLCWKEVPVNFYKRIGNEIVEEKNAFQGEVVYEIEAQISEGLPGLFLIGMKGSEAIVTREIIRSAIKMQGFVFPQGKITVSVRLIDDPMDTLSKDIADPALLSLDTKAASAIAIAILSASGQMCDLKDSEYLVGNELTLDGRMVPSPNSLDDGEVTLREHVEAINSAHAQELERCPNCHELLTSIDMREEAQINANNDGTFDIDCCYSEETKFYCPACRSQLALGCSDSGAYRVKSIIDPAASACHFTDTQLKDMWERLGDVAIDECECIDQPFYIWEKGTPREEIWHWFDERYSEGVHALMFEK